MKKTVFWFFLVVLIGPSLVFAQENDPDAISRRNELLGQLQNQKDSLAPDSLIIQTLNEILLVDQALLTSLREEAGQALKKDSLLNVLMSENEGLSSFVGAWNKNATFLYSLVAGVMLVLTILSALLIIARRKSRQMTADFHSRYLKLEGLNKNLSEEMQKVENAFLEKSSLAKSLQAELMRQQSEFNALAEESGQKEKDLARLSMALDEKSRLLAETVQKQKELERQSAELSGDREELKKEVSDLFHRLHLANQALEEEKLSERDAEPALIQKELEIKNLQKEWEKAQAKVTQLEEDLRTKELEVLEMGNRAARGMLEESRAKLDNLEINLLKLEKLHRLLELQAITPEEFNSMKVRILPELM